MLLRHSLGLEAEAAAVETAVSKAIDDGARTADIAEKGRTPISTRQMGEVILTQLN